MNELLPGEIRRKENLAGEGMVKSLRQGRIRSGFTRVFPINP